MNLPVIWPRPKFAIQAQARLFSQAFLTLLTLLTFLALLTFVGLLGASPASAGDIYQGQVERVVDGDTIQFLSDDYERVRVRLYGIDAPEKDQDGGGQSLAALTKLIAGRRVTIDVLDIDRYSRLVGLIYLDKDLVNLRMVEAGQAWVYEAYCKAKDVCGQLRTAQSKAQKSKVGLWTDPEAKPPWDHRSDKRRKKS